MGHVYCHVCAVNIVGVIRTADIWRVINYSIRTFCFSWDKILGEIRAKFIETSCGESNWAFHIIAKVDNMARKKVVRPIRLPNSRQNARQYMKRKIFGNQDIPMLGDGRNRNSSSEAVIKIVIYTTIIILRLYYLERFLTISCYFLFYYQRAIKV